MRLRVTILAGCDPWSGMDACIRLSRSDVEGFCGKATGLLPVAKGSVESAANGVAVMEAQRLGTCGLGLPGRC